MQKKAEKEANKVKKQNSKLRNNAIFGKSIENPMSKVDLKIVTTREQCLKWSFGLTFKGKKPFLKGAIPIEKEKCRISVNKSIYIGAYILDLSKVLMQDFHCNYIKNRDGGKAEMLLPDNDSLM